jgi:hypothetical protein
MARQQSLLAQAKWGAAQQDIIITEEQQRLAGHLMNQEGKLMNPGDLSATARQCLTTLNHLQLQPRAAEIAGLEAAAAMASALCAFSNCWMSACSLSFTASLNTESSSRRLSSLRLTSSAEGGCFGNNDVALPKCDIAVLLFFTIKF